MIQRKPKILPTLTCVTTCMNRANSIKKTLLSNIESSKDYPNVNFVLVNYGSNDDLDDFIKNNCKLHIDSGKLKYVKVLDKIEYFHHARAKNIGIKSATGDLIFNSDAEWKTTKEFFDLVFEEYKNGEEKKTLHIGGKGGAIVNYRKHLLMVRGYDENMVGWGMEDSDLFNRLRFGFEFEHKRTPFIPYVVPIERMHKQRDNSNISNKFLKNNRNIHENNMKQKKFIVNEEDKWGNATVLINFSEKIKI